MEDVKLVPEKEKMENGKEVFQAFHCDLYDTEIVHKIAQLFLLGLVAACVANTEIAILKKLTSHALDFIK